MARETLYDHPLYYDILFSWDRSVECDFYQHCFERYGVDRSGRVLEVACGTGQVARRLAHAGWNATGLDLSPGMLEFLARAAREEGIEVPTLCADMASFRTDAPFDAAVNPMSSFRLLGDDAAADAHLRAMSDALRPGAIYVLDSHFLSTPDEVVYTTDEDWEMERDGVTVSAGNDAIEVDDHGVRHVLAWGLEAHLRGYTVDAFVERVGAAPGLRVEGWHPESTRETGVSEFAAEPTEAPPGGRTMVVLRRI